MERPRLAPWAAARWHEGFVLLIDLRDGRTARVGPREWAVLRQLDGTRDLEGVRLAAARHGPRVSLEQVGAFVHELRRLDLLGQVGDVPEPSFAADRPIVPFPSYHLRCDGSGGCCRLFSTVVFTPREAARARGSLPLVDDLDGGFLPERGVEPGTLAGPMRDGACAYLEGARCALHAFGKPLGCQTYPDRYVDDGTSIRSGPGLECRCEVDSLLEPLADDPPSPARGAELPREVYVSIVPDTILTPAGPLPRGEYVEWEGELEPGADLAAWLWELSSGRTVAEVLGAWSARIELHLAQQSWRGPGDLVRRGLEWLRVATADAARQPRPRQPEVERLVFDATRHLHGLGLEGDARRAAERLALQLWVARAFPEVDEPAARHPITLVRALCRGYGLL
ncbi:MAG: hypothetical protein IT378_19175 [Sandaracinaceae bacterium]|nr:hypothetical protein [Sandaracinaceae bacterium]